MNFPKVLILIQPFNNNTGGGITLTNLFKGWPKDKIAVASIPGLVSTNLDTEICDKYYQLGEEELLWIFPFDLVKRKYPSGLLDFKEKTVQEIVPRKSKLRSRVLMNYIEPSLKWLGLMDLVYKLDLSQKFRDWLDDFQPDIIYAQAHGRNRVLFCSKVKAYLKKPMVFHMMDDWPEFVRDESILGGIWEKVVDREFRKLLQVSDLHLGISELMGSEYFRRYNIEFKTFHNPIDLDFWKKGQKSNWKINGDATILYAGRMGLGIDKSLEILAEAVTILNERSGTSIKFVLQVANKVDWMDQYHCVSHRPPVPYTDLPLKFGEADILYLPYDFAEKAVKFIKYSMPTKASEFMVSGTPILIFAPEETALVKYAEKYNWAKVVKVQEIEILVKALKELLGNEEERKSFGRRAIELAKDKHDATKVRIDFKEALNSVLV